MSDTPVDFETTITAAAPKPGGLQGYPGFATPDHAATDFASHSFVIEQMLGRYATVDIVQVRNVYNAGGVNPVGFVDVVPMVSQVDSAGNPTPHDVIYNLPYMRVQGGVNAVIIDPAVGDIGAALFCRRDISTVKRTRKPANPGSRRRFDWADGLYVGGFLNGVPTQYIRFSNTGVEIHTPNTLTVSAGSVVVNGPVQINGDVATTGALTNNGHAVGSTHQHLASGGTGLGGVPQ